MMPLSFAPEGQLLKLVSIQGGLGVQKRLTALGLTPGTEITIVAQNYDGPIILAVKDSRLAIGRGLLHHIQVEPQAETICESNSRNQEVGRFRHGQTRMSKHFGHHHW